MIIATTDNIAGKTITETLGLVQGGIVRAKHLGSDFAAGMRNLVGGEVKGYTEMMEHSRQDATDRMVAEAKKLGADAVVGVRYGSSTLMGGAAEILAYGTAVKLKK